MDSKKPTTVETAGDKPAAWINQQAELVICVRTMLVGPAVRIYEGHHIIGTGETLEEAVTAAMQKRQNVGAETTPDKAYEKSEPAQ